MDWPQILTTITEGNAISTVVDAPWVSVTSVNGMTGDVIVEPVVKGFQTNHYYQKDTVITYNGELYSAKANFTSGSSFNVANWDLLSSQVQSDWSVSDSSSKAFIKNKPTIGNATLTIQKNGTNVQTFTANATSNKTANIIVPTKTSDITNDSNFPVDASYVHTDNNYTTTEKNKLAGIASGAEVNVQSDWNQSTTTADDYIKNKPTIGNATLTIQKNGSTVKTFTANATSNVTANITVPTKTSELTNDADFATKLYVQSRGENLVTNGSGLLQNNYNFSSFTFDPLVANGTPGSFRTEALNTVIKNDELIPVDITQEYKLSFDIRTTNSSARFYDTIFSYDVDGNQIMYYNVNWLSGTTTTLSQKLSPGDTVVHLTSLSGWNTTTTYSYQKGFIFWNYVNSLGYAWGTETYSRNMYRNLYTDNSAVNKTANTITLDSAWTGPEIPAGTSVSQCTDGSNYIYIGTTNYTVTANTWVHRDSILTKNLYRIGTAFVGVGWLANRNISGTISTWFNNVQFAMYTAPITVDSALSSTSTNPVQNKIINSALGTKVNISDLATVATSGSYNDLSNKPTIGNATLTITQNGTSVGTFTANATSNKTIAVTDTTYSDATTSVSGLMSSTDKTKLNGIATGAEVNQNAFSNVKVGSTTVAADSKTDTLELVAGSNVTLTPDATNDKVTIAASVPTVNNATLTIQKNGSTVNTFTANASSNVTANITVPTKTSDLTNDSNFPVDASYVHTDNNFTTTLKNKLDGIASGAEVNVQSDWNQTTTTADDYIKNKPNLATVATSGSYNDLSNKPTIPTVNNATLTIQKNGSTVKTFTANASSNVTANITVPTKTSDITNDSNFITDSNAQIMASGQGNVAPCFDGMTPIKTFTWSVSDTTFRPVYQMDNTGWTYDNMDIEVAYRITVTGTGISQVCDINERWINPIGWPITSLINRTLSTAAATTGFRYLRAVYAKDAGLNNNTYKIGSEISNYDSTARTIQVDVFKTHSSVIWNETKPSGTIYTNSTYQANSNVQPYATRGWILRQPAYFYATNASSADAATRITSYEGYTVGSSVIKSGATALVADHLAYLADDGLVYDISNTTKNMVCDENGKVGLITTAVAASTAIGQTYFRPLTNLNSTQVGTISHATLALGNRVYLRCTMDASGNIHSDNYLATSMASGYTWLPIGVATATNTIYMDVRKPTFYTLNAEGKVTHINGKVLAGSGGGGGGSYTAGNHISIVNDVISAVDYVHSDTLMAATTPTGTVTTAMIADGAITRDKLASDAKFTLTMSTTDISEGSALATNTLYGVYNA